MFSNFRQCYQVMKDHTKIVKMLFWMIQKSKNEVFGYFLEFGLVDRLDIAYCERTKCFPTFGNVTRSQRIIQISQKCIFNDPKAQAYHTQLHLSFDGSKHFWMMIQSAKKRFSGRRFVESTWYCIFRVKDGANNLASIWHMLDHSKVTILHFWMIQSA